MKQKLQLKAQRSQLKDLLADVEEWLIEAACPSAKILSVLICAEEIFVNIASYAYDGKDGDVWIECDTEPGKMKLCFMDQGVPYDPLKREDPDITLSAEERQIGGLGIYMVRKMMDDVGYVYQDGKNCLSMEMGW